MSLVAPNIETLLNFKEWWEQAAVDTLKDFGINAKTSREFDTLDNTFVACEFDLGEANQERAIRTDPNNKFCEFNRFQSFLTFHIVTQRPKDEATGNFLEILSLHAEIEARIRRAMLHRSAENAFTPSRIPYYSLDAVPRFLNAIFNPDDMTFRDLTSITYEIKFSIQPDAWPPLENNANKLASADVSSWTKSACSVVGNAAGWIVTPTSSPSFIRNDGVVFIGGGDYGTFSCRLKNFGDSASVPLTMSIDTAVGPDLAITGVEIDGPGTVISSTGTLVTFDITNQSNWVFVKVTTDVKLTTGIHRIQIENTSNTDRWEIKNPKAEFGRRATNPES